MSQFEQYDHVLGFDDYEDRKRCSSCQTTPALRRFRNHRPPTGSDDCVRTTLSNADIFLIVLMIGLATGIVWLVYNLEYNSKVDGSRSDARSRANEHLKKMQKPPLLKRLWHVVWLSNPESIRRGRCQQNQQPNRSNGCSNRIRDTI